MSGTRLFIRNLEFHATRDEIAALFSSCGVVVDVVIVNDRGTGRPRGWGFVEMSTGKEAKLARERLDGQEIRGRAIRLDFATPRPPRLSREERSPFGEFFGTWNNPD